MSATPTAQRFIEELEEHRSPEQREKYRRYFKTGQGAFHPAYNANRPPMNHWNRPFSGCNCNRLAPALAP
jgi:hypothetical protein